MSRELTPQETAERSLIKKYRKELWNPFIAAVKRYELIVPGRREGERRPHSPSGENILKIPAGPLDTRAGE